MMQYWTGLSTAVKAVVIVVAVVVIYGIFSKAFNLWPWPNEEVIQAEANKTVAEAVAETATQAVDVVVEGDRERESLREAAAQVQDEIDKTPTNAPPAVTRRVVANAVCKLPEYAADPQCIQKAAAAAAAAEGDMR
jgi:hypothetical protein